VPKKDQAQALVYLRQIPYGDTAAEAARLKSKVQPWCRKRGGSRRKRRCPIGTFERRITFYGFPKEHGRHLRTTNPIESPLSALRLRRDAAKRFKKVENPLAVIWKMILVAERRFCRLNGPVLMRDVYQGMKSVDGVQRVEPFGRPVA
jgi:transposase-like protein